jgi:hypothetical protein
VRIEELDCLECVGNLGGEQVAVLEADLGGRAFEVNVSPTTLLKR